MKNKKKIFFTDKSGHNILRLFEVLTNFAFTTSETKRYN